MNEKVIVITGASSGIGRSTAELLAKQGNTLVLAARNKRALGEVAEACQESGAEVLVVPTDVSNEQEVQRLADVTVKKFGAVDVWINNAAVTAVGLFTDTPADAFRKVVETNFFGCVYGTRAALKYFRIQERGTIINVSSVFGAIPSPYETSYVASKFAIRGFSGSLREELMAEGAADIHICTVMPSAIDTPIYKNAANYTGRGLLPPPPIYDVQRVAATIADLTEKPKPEVIVGESGRGMYVARGHLPTGLFERLFSRYITSKHFTDEPASITDGNLDHASSFTDATGNWPREAFPHKKKLYVAGGIAAGIGLLMLVSRALSSDDEEEE